MAEVKRATQSGATKSKRAAKNAAVEEPYAAAKVKGVLDPEEAQLVTLKTEEIQGVGATVTAGRVVEGSIERIVTVGGSPEVVGKVILERGFR
jgi:hypothetical protein